MAAGPSQIALRLCAGATAAALIPWLIEWLLQDPAFLARFDNPVSASIRLSLGLIAPYLCASLGAVFLAWRVSRRGGPADFAPPRFSAGLAAAGLGLAVLAAWLQPGIESWLLRGGVGVSGGRAAVGSAGPFSLTLPVVALPLESSSPLLRRELPAAPAPFDAAVRWFAVRLSTAGAARADLIGAGARIDLDSQLDGLKPGVPRLLSHALRSGPAPAAVRVRADVALVGTETLFDSRSGALPAGSVLDAGGGDRARLLAKQEPERPGNVELQIQGRHEGGYAVFVLSGSRWQKRDLTQLMMHQGRLELALDRSGAAPHWSVVFVADGIETAPVSLSSFAAEGGSALSLPLSVLDWKDLDPSAVGGIAFKYAGPPGPFELILKSVKVAPSRLRQSGFAVLASDGLDPGQRPLVFMAAGPRSSPARIWQDPAWLRLAAAFAVIGAALGPAAARGLIARLPWTVLGSLAAGVMALSAFYFLLPKLLPHRIEHLPLASLLAGATVGLFALRPPGRLESAGAEDSPAAPGHGHVFAWLEALRVVAAVGVIAIHVCSDSAGLPFSGSLAEERLGPLVLRAVAQGFNYHIFFLISLFLLAHRIKNRPQPYKTTLRERLRRLAPPFVFWTLLYLGFRFWKAHVFGYEGAYAWELSSPGSWLGYFILGEGQYHLHFVPLLLALTALHPLYAFGLKRPGPAALLGAVLLMALPFVDREVYGSAAPAAMRPYLLFASKTVSYMGYGLLAYALYAVYSQGLDGRKRQNLLIAACAATVLSLGLLIRHAWATAAAGFWLVPDLATHAAISYLPAAVFTLFMFLDRARFPAAWTSQSRLAFGVYLCHPVILDTLQILQKNRLSPMASAVVNLAAVTAGAWLLARALDRRRALAWMIGGGRHARS